MKSNQIKHEKYILFWDFIDDLGFEVRPANAKQAVL